MCTSKPTITAMDRTAALPVEWECRPENDETALLHAARQDPKAFGELYKHHLARIYSYMRARTPTDEDAADLSQQVFLQAFKSFPKYRDRGVPFVAWLFRIARNVATDAHRRSRATVSLDVVPESSYPADEEDPEAVALRREQILHARTLLSNLPPDKRELITLRFVAGLTLREIALVVGRSESTVHYQLGVTLQSLKEWSREE